MAFILITAKTELAIETTSRAIANHECAYRWKYPAQTGAWAYFEYTGEHWEAIYSALGGRRKGIVQVKVLQGWFPIDFYFGNDQHYLFCMYGAEDVHSVYKGFYQAQGGKGQVHRTAIATDYIRDNFFTQGVIYAPLNSGQKHVGESLKKMFYEGTSIQNSFGLQGGLAQISARSQLGLVRETFIHNYYSKIDWSLPQFIIGMDGEFRLARKNDYLRTRNLDPRCDNLIVSSYWDRFTPKHVQQGTVFTAFQNSSQKQQHEAFVLNALHGQEGVGGAHTLSTQVNVALTPQLGALNVYGTDPLLNSDSDRLIGVLTKNSAQKMADKMEAQDIWYQKDVDAEKSETSISAGLRKFTYDARSGIPFHLQLAKWRAGLHKLYSNLDESKAQRKAYYKNVKEQDVLAEHRYFQQAGRQSYLMLNDNQMANFNAISEAVALGEADAEDVELARAGSNVKPFGYSKELVEANRKRYQRRSGFTTFDAAREALKTCPDAEKFVASDGWTYIKNKYDSTIQRRPDVQQQAGVIVENRDGTEAVFVQRTPAGINALKVVSDTAPARPSRTLTNDEVIAVKGVKHFRTIASSLSDRIANLRSQRAFGGSGGINSNVTTAAVITPSTSQRGDPSMVAPFTAGVSYITAPPMITRQEALSVQNDNISMLPTTRENIDAANETVADVLYLAPDIANEHVQIPPTVQNTIRGESGNVAAPCKKGGWQDTARSVAKGVAIAGGIAAVGTLAALAIKRRADIRSGVSGEKALLDARLKVIEAEKQTVLGSLWDKAGAYKDAVVNITKGVGGILKDEVMSHIRTVKEDVQSREIQEEENPYDVAMPSSSPVSAVEYVTSKIVDKCPAPDVQSIPTELPFNRLVGGDAGYNPHSSGVSITELGDEGKDIDPTQIPSVLELPNSAEEEQKEITNESLVKAGVSLSLLKLLAI